MTLAQKIAYGAAFLVACALLPAATLAQENPILVDAPLYAPSAEDISVQMSPENPGPFARVTIQLTSNLVDLSRYPISWVVDGKPSASGTGMRTYQVAAKNYNQTTQVQVSVALPSGTITRSIMVRPTDMTVLWEAVDASVPPFYPGKKLPASESLIKFTALPHFGGSNALADAKTDVYRWERNGNVVSDASGYGKNSFLIAQNRVRPDETVTVTATDQAGTTTATATKTVSVVTPHILFYERDAATGLRSPTVRASVALQGADTTIIAEPYYFSIPSGNPNNLSFHWTMNDQPIAIQNTKYPSILELKRPESSGRATIAVTITNPVRLLQTARNALSASFTNK